MVSYTFDGNEFVLRRPAITTFRPLTDNDRGAGHGFERAQWLGAGRYARCVDNEIEQIDENTVKATYTYELATPQRTKVTVRYTAHTDGRVNLHVEYPGEQGDLPTIPAFGIEWTLPVQYTNLRFFGTGRRRRTWTANTPSSACGAPTLSRIMRRTSCRRRRATMRMCVGPRLPTITATACASAAPMVPRRSR